MPKFREISPQNVKMGRMTKIAVFTGISTKFGVTDKNCEKNRIKGV
jgi:hypothetical protein